MRYTTSDPAVPSVPVSHDMGGTYDAPASYTGNGFTASEHHLVPEYRYGQAVRAEPGAEIWRVNADGSEQLAGVLNDDGVWVRVE